VLITEYEQYERKKAQSPRLQDEHLQRQSPIYQRGAKRPSFLHGPATAPPDTVHPNPSVASFSHFDRFAIAG